MITRVDAGNREIKGIGFTLCGVSFWIDSFDAFEFGKGDFVVGSVGRGKGGRLDEWGSCNLRSGSRGERIEMGRVGRRIGLGLRKDREDVCIICWKEMKRDRNVGVLR